MVSQLIECFVDIDLLVFYRGEGGPCLNPLYSNLSGLSLAWLPGKHHLNLILLGEGGRLMIDQR